MTDPFSAAILSNSPTMSNRLTASTGSQGLPTAPEMRWARSVRGFRRLSHPRKRQIRSFRENRV
jgi:hypothetical protein